MREFGAWLNGVFGPSIHDIGEVAHFKTSHWKLRNGIRFKEKYERLKEEHGTEQIDFIAARIGVPLIEAAVNEDNDDLQELYARLMIANVSSELIVLKRRSFVEALKQFEPPDASLLKMMSLFFKHSVQEKTPGFVWRGWLEDIFRFGFSFATLSQ
jgi:hypothetical protein